MAENTTVGPAGGNSAAMPITPHQTFSKTDETQTDGFGDAAGDAAPSNVTLSGVGELKPVNS